MISGSWALALQQSGYEIQQNPRDSRRALNHHISRWIPLIFRQFPFHVSLSNSISLKQHLSKRRTISSHFEIMSSPYLGRLALRTYRSEHPAKLSRCYQQSICTDSFHLRRPNPYIKNIFIQTTILRSLYYGVSFSTSSKTRGWDAENGRIITEVEDMRLQMDFTGQKIWGFHIYRCVYSSSSDWV